LKTARWSSDVLQDGWAQIPNSVLLGMEISPVAFKLYALLVHFAWAVEDDWPGQSGLAALVGVSENPLRKATEELIRAKLIETERRGQGRTNVYRLLDPPAGSRTSDSAVQEPQILPIPLSIEDPLEDSPPSPPPGMDPITVVYGLWRTKRNRMRRNYDRISPARKRVIAARLKDGYTVEQLERALDGVAVDEARWPERANQDDLTIVFRRENVDKFLDLAAEKDEKRQRAAVCPECGIGGGRHLADCSRYVETDAAA
jgi:hypothetical protein